jgi:nucleotide-binding universal stress UspA family protein
MSTHGYSGLVGLVLGSVARETLQRGTVPVLVFRRGDQKDPETVEQSSSAAQEVRPYTLLVALDLTEKADAALGPTARLAEVSGARIVFVNVIRPTTDLGHVVAGRTQALQFVRNERLLYLAEKAPTIQTRIVFQLSRSRRKRRHDSWIDTDQLG